MLLLRRIVFFYPSSVFYFSSKLHVTPDLRWESSSDKNQHRPHGPASLPGATLRGGCGPRVCALLPLPAVFLSPGDGGALRPDGGGSLRLHLHLYLPGGADHLRQWGSPISTLTGDLWGKTLQQWPLLSNSTSWNIYFFFFQFCENKTQSTNWRTKSHNLTYRSYKTSYILLYLWIYSPSFY